MVPPVLQISLVYDVLQHDLVACMITVLAQVAEFVIVLPFIDLEETSNVAPMDRLFALACEGVLHDRGQARLHHV